MAPSRASTEAPATGADRKWSVPQPGERLAVWTLWFTYGMFYFCRSNLSVAVPGMKAPIAEGGLGYSSEQIGLILASLKISYGVGQLVNGQLSERISPRVLLAAGMFGSAALNVIFGLSTGLYFLLFVWACNGYCQSLGWTPCMRVVSNWVPVLRRGRAIGLIGTGYQITMGLTYVVASWAADRYGWRGALFIPSIMLATAGLAMLMLLRESPEDAPEPAAEQPAAPRAATTTVRENLFLTLFNPALWLLGASLGLLNACRYGFLDWGVAHLMEIHGGSKAAGGLTISGAGLSFGFIAFGAAAGVYLTGWATDRFFGGRRAPMIVSMLVPLGLLALIYHQVAVASLHGAIALLVVIGFCIFGPQVLLVGTAPADLAHRRGGCGFCQLHGLFGGGGGRHCDRLFFRRIPRRVAGGDLDLGGMGLCRGRMRRIVMERHRVATEPPAAVRPQGGRWIDPCARRSGPVERRQSRMGSRCGDCVRGTPRGSGAPQMGGGGEPGRGDDVIGASVRRTASCSGRRLPVAARRSESGLRDWDHFFDHGDCGQTITAWGRPSTSHIGLFVAEFARTPSGLSVESEVLRLPLRSRSRSLQAN